MGIEFSMPGVMGDIFHEDFEDINNYVPRFYLQPLVTKPSGHHNVSYVTQQDYTHFEFPKYLQWYIRPTEDLRYEGNVNRHEFSKPEETIYDSLVNKLITDHGWKLEDFDILNNKAKFLMRKYGYENGEKIENKETSNRNSVPACHSKGIRGQIGVINQYQQLENNHAIDETFQEKIQSHRGLKSTRSYSGFKMLYKQSHNSDYKHREYFWSTYQNEAGFNTRFVEEVNHIMSQNHYSEGKYYQQTLAHNTDKNTVLKNNIGRIRSRYSNCDVLFINRRDQYHSYNPNKSLEYIYISRRHLEDVRRQFLSNKNTFNKTYEGSEETQHFTIPVKSKNESLTPTIIQKNGEQNYSFFSNSTGTISSQKVFKAQSKPIENFVPFEMNQNLIETSKISSQDIRKTEKYTSSWENEQQLNNSNPLESVSKELYNHSTNCRPVFTATGTEILHSGRERFGIQNKQKYTDNTISKTKQTYMRDIPISSKYYEINNGDQTPYEGLGKQGSGSQLRQKTLFVQEQIDRIVNVLNQSKQDYITSRNSKNINSNAGINESQSNAQSLTVLESRQNNNNDKSFKSLRQSNFYDGIISSLKNSQHLSKSNGKLNYTNLASFTKGVLQGCSQFVRTEKLTSSAHHPQSSAIPLLITNSKEIGTITTEISATAKEKHISSIEKHTPLGLPNPSESTNVKLQNSNFNSNTNGYSEFLNSERNPLQSESLNLRLEDWALKSQLFSEIIKRKENAKGGTHKYLENVITTQKQISNESRKYEENSDLKNNCQTSLKSGIYVSQPTIQKPPLPPQKPLREEYVTSPTIETKSSHQTFQSTTYDQRNLSKGFSSQPKIKSYVKQPKSYLNRRVGHTLKNMHFRRTNIKRVNTKIQNSRFNNTLPIIQTSLESLWHDQKMKRVSEKMRAIRLNKTRWTNLP